MSLEPPWNTEGWFIIGDGELPVKFAFRADNDGTWFFCIHKTDTLGVLLGKTKGFIEEGTGYLNKQHVKDIIQDSCVKYTQQDNRLLSQRIRDAKKGIMDADTTTFIMMCDQMNHRIGRPLTISQMFEVALYLGYRKVRPKGEHSLWQDP